MRLCRNSWIVVGNHRSRNSRHASLQKSQTVATLEGTCNTLPHCGVIFFLIDIKIRLIVQPWWICKTPDLKTHWSSCFKGFAPPGSQTKRFPIACTSANHSNTTPPLISEEFKSIKTLRKEEWLIIGCTLWSFHRSQRHATTKAVSEGLKLQEVTGSSVPRVASGENGGRYILEVYRDVREVEQKAKRKMCGCCPQYRSCRVFWAQTNP